MARTRKLLRDLRSLGITATTQSTFGRTEQAWVVEKSVFVNYGGYVTMAQGFTYEDMKEDAARVGAELAARLAELGWSPCTPVDFFTGADNLIHTTHPMGGFYAEM